jgi:hypothetical protein
MGDLTCAPFTCSPEPEADCLPISSSGTSQLPLLSGTDTPAKSSASEPPRDGSPACACTREMSGCSIHPNTRDEWIASMRASLARTLATPESRQALAQIRAAASTVKSSASLTSFDPDSCSWRTSQRSFLTDWEPFSETWPRAGMTVGGHAYELPTWVRLIAGTDGGVSPDGLTFHHTPTTAGMDGGSNSRRALKARRQAFATPASTANQLCPSMLKHPGCAAMWPTPTRGDSKSSGSRNTATSKANAGVSLTDFVRQDGGVGRLWPTPSSNDWKGSSKDGQRRGQLADPAMGVIPAGGSLNPTWVEWLMAWPLNWTKAMHIKPNSGRKAARKLTERKTCERCPQTTGLEVHHKDRDPTNNAPENREVLCQSCHQQEHITAGDWGHGKVPTATCEICGAAFQPKRSRRATLCGSKECATEKGRRSAAARWDGGTQSQTLAASPAES